LTGSTGLTGFYISGFPACPAIAFAQATAKGKPENSIAFGEEKNHIVAVTQCQNRFDVFHSLIKAT